MRSCTVPESAHTRAEAGAHATTARMNRLTQNLAADLCSAFKIVHLFLIFFHVFLRLQWRTYYHNHTRDMNLGMSEFSEAGVGFVPALLDQATRVSRKGLCSSCEILDRLIAQKGTTPKTYEVDLKTG